MSPRELMEGHREAVDPAPPRVAGPPQRDLLTEVRALRRALGVAEDRARDQRILIFVAGAGGFVLGFVLGFGSV